MKWPWPCGTDSESVKPEAVLERIVHACPDLSILAKGSNPGERQRASLRRIIVHMIEETARHAGHADILRERIDGATDL